MLISESVLPWIKFPKSEISEWPTVDLDENFFVLMLSKLLPLFLFINKTVENYTVKFRQLSFLNKNWHFKSASNDTPAFARLVQISLRRLRVIFSTKRDKRILDLSLFKGVARDPKFARDWTAMASFAAKRRETHTHTHTHRETNSRKLPAY